MHRLVLACAGSLLLYGLLFAFVLDRPLTLGALRARIEANLARGAAIEGRKLVIIAGSNGPYSHRCELIEARIGIPCVNAGVAVGVGLDYLFARWQALLHPGDIVYLPLEEAQYGRRRAMAELGPDASIMLRHDRGTLAGMPWHRQLAALFAGDLRGAVMSVIETALVRDGFQDPRAAATGTFNAWGDHVGHTAAIGAANQPTLATFTPFHPTGAEVVSGYGTAEVARFLDWARQHGVRTIGGLPTGFADSPIRPGALAAIEGLYRTHGAAFLTLPNLSRYPRAAFFDTADHLNEVAQIRHSEAVAKRLAEMLADRSMLTAQMH
ncbi:MAG TPA: hypothetical protein VHB27_22705 [Rhodopila sp.]|uniref:hypothetical protein n=1 Tax=Rhodopila sp. TaxID=2480087 RepID=UPI002B84BB4B|nr:hypothetical protein [Rhodopila sp.]HVY18047.1 hypothetical protein [Rhodopila sp.]